MASDEHVTLLRKGIVEWNPWRRRNRDIRPNLAHANLTNIDLTYRELTDPDSLHRSLAFDPDFIERDCSYLAGLPRVDLIDADLTEAVLSGAFLTNADLRGARIVGAMLPRVSLTHADLTAANLANANLAGADLEAASLVGAKLTDAKTKQSSS